MKKSILLIIGLVLLSVFTGCASTALEGPEQKDCAIVSIMYNKRLYFENTTTTVEKDGSFTETTTVYGADNPLSNIFFKKLEPTEIQTLKAKEYVAPLVEDANEIIRKRLSERSNVKLVPVDELNSVDEYAALRNKASSKLLSIANRITSEDYVLADNTCRIEPVLNEKTGSNLFAYIDVDIQKNIKGMKSIQTGTLYPQISITCVFNDSTGKQISNNFVVYVPKKGIKIAFGKYETDEFYDNCLTAIDEAMAKLMLQYK